MRSPTFPKTRTSERSSRRHAQRSIGLYGMGSYRPDGGTGPPQLVLGFGNLSDAAIERGITVISDLL